MIREYPVSNCEPLVLRAVFRLPSDWCRKSVTNLSEHLLGAKGSMPIAFPATERTELRDDCTAIPQ